MKSQCMNEVNQAYTRMHCIFQVEVPRVVRMIHNRRFISQSKLQPGGGVFHTCHPRYFTLIQRQAFDEFEHTYSCHYYTHTGNGRSNMRLSRSFHPSISPGPRHRGRTPMQTLFICFVNQELTREHGVNEKCTKLPQSQRLTLERTFSFILQVVSAIA